MPDEKTQNHLIRLIKTFVIMEKQMRFLELMNMSKRYEDFLYELLNDSRNLNSDCIIEIPRNKQTPEMILEQLVIAGARKTELSYVVSLDWDINGKSATLEKILPQAACRDFGTLIYCTNSHLGFFEDHESYRCILQPVK